MKKNLAIVILLVAVLFCSACGKSDSEEVNLELPSNTATSVQEMDDVMEPAEEPSVTNGPTEEQVKELVPIEETLVIPEGFISMNSNNSSVSFGEYDKYDTMEAYFEYEEFIPYYVGKNEESTNFITNNKNENDEVLYLGLPMYLPKKLSDNVSYVEIDDKSIAEIQGEELVALKEGIFNLNCYDSEMNLVEIKRFIATTFNDSIENIESYRTLKGNQLYNHINAWDIDYWKASVHTIMDMTFMLQARDFKYDFTGEPKFGVIEGFEDPINLWCWTADANTIFDMSKGVCIQVAQLAVYMLDDDFQECGVVMVDGNQGHIFNWFYEDGFYYIFDFTKVISDNAWSKDGSSFHTYWDYSKEVKKFQSIEEIKKWCMTEKVDLTKNYTIYMYSCKGHEYIACNVNTGMSDSNACLTGEWSNITIGFQDVVMEDLIVLWENPNSCKINWKSFTIEEMNPNIPCGIYNYKRNLVFRHEY